MGHTRRDRPLRPTEPVLRAAMAGSGACSRGVGARVRVWRPLGSPLTEPAVSLSAALQGAATRIIGLTLETRPDVIDLHEIARLRSYGCTRLQVGGLWLRWPRLVLPSN